MAFNPFDNTEKHSTATRKSPFGSRESSPGPDRLTALQHDSPKRGPSPCLPRKTLEELETGTVDPDDPPLSSPWTFWFERAPTAGAMSVASEDYSQGLKHIYTVRTIKQFFSVYNNLKSPSLLRPKECYHLMRSRGKDENPRKPMWEDPDNLSGGIWVFKCRKDMTVVVWLELLLAAIGEQFSDSTAQGDDVVGVSIKIREYETDTLQIWNENATQNESAKVMERVRSIMPSFEIRDYFYGSIKDKLSGNRSYQAPPTQYKDSPPPQSKARHSPNPPHVSSYRHPPGGGAHKKGPDGYYRYPSPRQSGAGPHKFPSHHPQQSSSSPS